VVDEDVLTLAELESAREKTQRQRRRPDERDLPGLAIQQLRRQPAPVVQRLWINQLFLIATGGRVRVVCHRLRHAMRQRTIPRVREKDPAPGDGKLALPQLFLGQNLGDSHTQAYKSCGSRESRNSGAEGDGKERTRMGRVKRS